MNVLITGVGGSTGRGAAASLKRHGRTRPFTLVATDADPGAAGLYDRELFDAAYVVPRANAGGYWEAIDRIVDQHQIDAAVVMPEVEVLAWGRRASEGTLPCRALVPDPTVTERVIDKAATSEALEPLGLAPRSILFARDRPPADLGAQLGWPCWIRSPVGTSGAGSFRADSAQALRAWITVKSHVPCFLASPFLAGRNLACALLYYDGRLLRAACAERLRYLMAEVAPSGITGHTSHGRLLNDPAVVAIAAAAADHLFAHSGSIKQGLLTVDLKEDAEGRAYVTEINARHVGLVECFSAAGANLIEDTLRLLAGDPTFDRRFVAYEFANDPVFLRGVDSAPVVIPAESLLPALRPDAG